MFTADLHFWKDDWNEIGACRIVLELAENEYISAKSPIWCQIVYMED